MPIGIECADLKTAANVVEAGLQPAAGVDQPDLRAQQLGGKAVAFQTATRRFDVKGANTYAEIASREVQKPNLKCVVKLANVNQPGLREIVVRDRVKRCQRSDRRFLVQVQQARRNAVHVGVTGKELDRTTRANPNLNRRPANT